jgi:hypothetical protein
MSSYGGLPAKLAGGGVAGVTIRTVKSLSSLPSDGGGSGSEEEIIDVSEADVLAALERDEPAWTTVSRLFRGGEATGIAADLQAKGWAVVPAEKLPPPTTIETLRAAALALHASGGMRNASDTAAPGTRSDAVAFVAEDGGGVDGLGPALAWLASLRTELAPFIALTGAVEHQLAVYTPGAHYGRHRDALPDDGAAGRATRRVTAVLYGQTEWRDTLGGQLRLWPPTAGGDETSVDVPPVGAVVFLSGAVDHEVLPVGECAGERVALTAWMW